jgi:peptidoglycan/LPS O-acetylase OafA/YrhL
LMPLPNYAPDNIRSYKPFVDGLRAIAILTVVGSHVDLPGFGGGFVGVDVFFVISGYLIINQIIVDIENKRFSPFDFWARRAFRILPPFLLVMVTCLVLATTLFVLPEYKDFAESFFFSAIMLVNHHFLSHQGYFDLAAFTKPLLHMWSLAVEEQFYLFAPLILLGVKAACHKMNPEKAWKTSAAFTLVLAIASFILCVAFTYPFGHPNVSFYIMPTRGWEFILGGIAPSLVRVFCKSAAWIVKYLAIFGIVAIGLSVAFFGADTLYPSYRAALPAFGAMLIIVGGLAEPNNSVARLLASWPMVRIGLVSYSWYLWHWPLISFVRTASDGWSDIGQEVSAAVLALGLAILTYIFIELPVRRWRHSRPYRPAAIVALGVASCISIACVGFVWSLRIAPAMQPTLTGLEPVVISKRGFPSPSHHGLLLGDSHAAMLMPLFQENASEAGSALAVAWAAACPPLLGIGVGNFQGYPDPSCREFLQKLSFDGDEFVIIASRWNYYLGLPPSDPFYPSYDLMDNWESAPSKNPYLLLAKGLAATISKAKHSGVRRILVVGPLPEYPWQPPYCAKRSILIGVDKCTIARAKVDARRTRTMVIFRRVIAGVEGIRLIDPINLFCTESKCRPNKGRLLYFRDVTHLSPAGIELLYKTYEKDFQWALTGEDDGKSPMGASDLSR